ncbi:CPBP family intramembrane glutamic endopeptidase [Ktedonosporobacter rubrisoli]|nr:CPBP family intramembrane glutamic endopeptidase [Ktedonosporobacter rubrisoli]
MTLVTAFFSIFLTPGEEIGWRGFMLTRLVEAKVPAPLLVSGLIWGLFHVPDILSGQYKPGGGPNIWLALALFFVSLVAFSYFLNWLRLRSGSIWPCILAHGAWNAVTQVGLNPLVHGANAQLWIGESGILVALVAVIVIVAFYRLWPLREMLRQPEQPIVNGEKA